MREFNSSRTAARHMPEAQACLSSELMALWIARSNMGPRGHRSRQPARSLDHLPHLLGSRAGQNAFTLQSLPGALLPQPDKPPVPGQSRTASLCTPALLPGPLSERSSSGCPATLPGQHPRHRTAVTHRPRPGALHAEDAVPGRPPPTWCPSRGRAAPCDELGAAAEAGVRHQGRDLRCTAS